MRSIFIFIILILGLAGCASTHGNYVAATAPINLTEKLIADTEKQITALYPPGSTSFAIKQSIPSSDAFGTGLLKALRNQGYSILEFSTLSKSDSGSGSGQPLQYVLDTPAKGLYRLSITAGKTLLTRAYTVQNNVVVPAGAWVKLEQ